MSNLLVTLFRYLKYSRTQDLNFISFFHDVFKKDAKEEKKFISINDGVEMSKNLTWVDDSPDQNVNANFVQIKVKSSGIVDAKATRESCVQCTIKKV